MLAGNLDRYIVRQLAVALVAVTGGLVALIWLTQSLRFIELVVNRGLSLAVFLRLTGLLIPNFVSIILPITTFVVTLFVYQRMAGDRELTVMRGTGLSPGALARPALIVALLVMLAGWALTIWIVPASFGAFRTFQFEIRNKVAAFLLQEGVFTPVGDDLTVYVRTRDRDGTLRGILVDDARQKNARATIFAERGRIVTEGEPRVLLSNGSRQEVDRATGRLNILSFSENAIDLGQAARAADIRLRDPAEMSLAELRDPVPGTVLDRDRPKLAVEATRRLSQPLSTLSFTLVALTAVLTAGFRRRGFPLGPAVGVVAMVGLLATGLAVGNLAARDPRMLALMWLQAAGPAVVCAVWLLRPGPRAVETPRLAAFVRA